MRRREAVRRARLAMFVVLLGVAAAVAAWSTQPSGVTPGGCRGAARCYTGTVEAIVDGDTLDVGAHRIRLALVDTPEVGEPGYQEAKDFTASRCPIGSYARVDEDDGQTEGSYGRVVARVVCGGTLLNEALVVAGLATRETQFCPVSEFADEPWTGCP